jgi:hypothetical protein
MMRTKGQLISGQLDKTLVRQYFPTANAIEKQHVCVPDANLIEP